MANGREYSAAQRKIINRYYGQIDTILITRLSEICTEIALAQGDEKKLDRLWKRASQALGRIKDENGEPDPKAARVLRDRDLQALGKLVSRLSS